MELPVIPFEDLPSRIAHAILFPNLGVRLQALRYFSRAANPPETIMPRVIEAIEQYGRDNAYPLLQEANHLPQTEATIAWICSELEKDWPCDDPRIDNYCLALADILCHAPLELLREDMTSLRSFPDELKPGFLERFALATQDWDTLLAALTALGQDVVSEKHTSGFVRRKTARLVEAMGRHTDKAKTVVAALCDEVADDLSDEDTDEDTDEDDTDEDIDDISDEDIENFLDNYVDEEDDEADDGDESLEAWLEIAMIRIAGAMRLEKAVDALIDILRLESFASPWTLPAMDALRRIGGDEVANRLFRLWPTEDPDLFETVVFTLDDIHTRTLQDAYWETFNSLPATDEKRPMLVGLLLANFDSRGIETMRAILNTEGLKQEWGHLKPKAVAAAAVLGVTFPELDEWLKDVAQEATQSADRDAKDSLRWVYDESPTREENLLDADSWDDWIEMGEDDDWDFDEDDLPKFGFHDSHDDDDDDDYPYDEPYRNEASNVGRNAPCPCGSGKKYKQCCLGKPVADVVEDMSSEESPAQQAFSKIERRGPDNRRTTRIIATVPTGLGDSTISREWKGNNLSFNAKARMEIREFFARYGEPMPDDSGPNVGCPHEAGKDYPAGGDCPHCPFWKGKQ